MMAATVMVLVITSSLTTMQRAFLSLDTARCITIAGQIMQSEFEKMRLRDWSVIGAYSTAETTVALDPSFTSHPSVGTRYSVVRNVTEISAVMRQITLTVSWRTVDGRRLSRSYTSYYGQNGLYDYYYNSL